jgi:hypothetical protein
MNGQVYLMVALGVFAVASAHADPHRRVVVNQPDVMSAGNADSQLAPAGTDTGNGGGGGRAMRAIPRYERTSVSAWCNDVQGWMADAIESAQFMGSHAGAREYMVGAINAMLDAYENSDLPFQPLTYSLLSRALQMDSVFPKCENKCDDYSLANRVSTLLLAHMLNLGIEVNAKFDVPQYTRYYESTRCRDCATFDFSSFNVDYISNVQSVLATFFGPAFERASPSGSLLDAMGRTEWELRAQSVLLDWVVTDIRSDVFGRKFSCLASRLVEVKKKLDDHLAGRPIWDDLRMMHYVRVSLGGVLDLLEHSNFKDDGVYYCYRSGR